MQGIDPLAPDIAAWIAEKTEEDELVIRLAFLELFARCRQNRSWLDRIAELSAALVNNKMDEDSFAWRAERLCDSMEHWLQDQGLSHCRYLH